MTGKRLLSLGIIPSIVGFALLWTSNLIACEVRPNPQDFRWELAEDAFPQPSGMLLIAYEDAGSHQTTHATYHRVVRIVPRPVLGAVSNGTDEILVEVDGGIGPLIYVIVSAPLYYGTDLDEMGLPRRVWLDPEEDGLNGNEMLMDRPAT